MRAFTLAFRNRFCEVKMALDGSYLIVCEGASEANYLTLLTRLLQTLQPPECLKGRSLRFNLPHLDGVSHDTQTAYAGKCVGGGRYTYLEKAYRKTKKDNAGVDIRVWADWDLYTRNDQNCLTDYMNKPQGIPDFLFSFQNFEDFWAMHLEDDIFQAWLNLMTAKHHWTMPLHSKDYLPLFRQTCVVGYDKGELQEELTVERLNNMRRHIPAVQALFPNTLPPTFHWFAEFLSDTLNRFYPEVFP